MGHNFRMTPAPFPQNRPRRLRRDAFTRNLVREHRLSAHDFIYPVFVHAGQGRSEAVPSMPGVERLSLDLLLPVAEDCVKLGIPVLALFPAIEAGLKTPDGKEALNPEGLIPRVVRTLKKEFPDLGVLTDVALGPYTTGVFANDDDMAEELLDAARKTGEDAWRMPLTHALREQLKSDIADTKNTGERYGGAITAALFLSEFVGDIPWIHLDIAGPIWSKKDSGAMTKGGSGVMVATLIEMLTH